jgi:hypothetical protein
MTIEKRLEALTMSLELQAQETQDFKREVRQAVQTLSELHAETERRIASNEELARRLHAETERRIASNEKLVNRLANIAIAHEDRIEKLET